MLLVLLAALLLVAVTSETDADNETPLQSINSERSNAESSPESRWHTVRGLTSTSENASVRKIYQFK